MTNTIVIHGNPCITLAPLLSNRISVIHGSRINYETICCPQFCTYSYQIFCVMWEGQALPHDTKFGNSRCEIVGRRVILIWSLIHGLRWSGLIKAEPGCNWWLWMEVIHHPWYWQWCFIGNAVGGGFICLKWYGISFTVKALTRGLAGPWLCIFFLIEALSCT